jgi:alpha-mannosidase
MNPDRTVNLFLFNLDLDRVESQFERGRAGDWDPAARMRRAKRREKGVIRRGAAAGSFGWGACRRRLDERKTSRYGGCAGGPCAPSTRPQTTFARPVLAMKFTDLTVLLPCHSLEDFPTYYEGSQADELLVAWCALWHPAALASAGSVPRWQRIDDPPSELAGRVLAIPPFCVDRLPAGFLARAEQEAACVVRAADCPAARATLLAGLDGGGASVAAELADDFLALGFCQLQVELLTRQMRYSANIDEAHFQNEAVAAAHAAVAGDDAAAREHLQRCFDTLYDSRKHFYPVDVYLLDLTLAAASTSGESLRAELDQGTPTNLCLSTATLQMIHDEHPTAWKRLLQAVDAGALCVVGGEAEEIELPLLPLEAARASLAAGVLQYEALLGRRPQVYSRRRAGLSPTLPQLLVKFAYQGALHFTLDDGRFALGAQTKTRWEGLDGNVIDVFARVPQDAARPETFLSLSRKLADSMDTDHVATLALAHWPAASSPWHDVLRRVARLSPVLGKFMLLDDYFSHTDMPGRISKFGPDEYRTPYLTQDVARGASDPISRFVVAHRAAAERAALDALGTLHDLIAGGPPQPRCQTAEEAARRVSALLPRESGSPQPGHLVMNPLSFARNVGFEKSCEPGGREITRDVADVPPMGFAWVAADGAPASARAKPLARENVLGNEFFEATISRATGGIQSIYNFKQRGNQLSQQLACRLAAPPREPGADWHAASAAPGYTTMRAESVEITAASPLHGEIVSRGILVDDHGRKWARFRQTTQIWAGSRVLAIEIELEELEELMPDPWNSYYAARFAWPDESADLWRGVGLSRCRSDAARLEAPEYLDIQPASGRISILTGGLPYHRRSDPRMLDSLLVVRGERARRFRLGVGIDLPQPAASALEFVSPSTVLADAGPPLAPRSGWLFHVDAKNVVATHWEPVLATDAPGDPPPGGGSVRGFRVRLLETAGRGGPLKLRSFRPVAAARQIDFLGQTTVEAPVEDDKIRLDFAANEWIELEAIWKV